MAVNFKKVLLTGTALVMVGSFSGQANAAALTFTAATNTNATATNDTWDVAAQPGFTNATLTWNGAGAVGVTASGTGTANVGGLTVTSVAGANTLVIGNNTLASTLIVNGNIAGDVSANDLAISVTATGNTSSSALQLKGTTMALGSSTGITLDSGTGGGIASVVLNGTGAQSFSGDIRGAVAGDGVLSVTNTGGTVTFSSAIGSNALGHIGTGGATGTSTVVFNGAVSASNASASSGGDGAIVLGQTDGGSSNTTFKGNVTATSIGLGVAGAGVDTNTVTFDATGGNITVSAALAGATAADTNNLLILGGGGRTVTFNSGGSNLDNVSINQNGTTLALGGSFSGTGTVNFDSAGTLNVNGGTLSFASAASIDMKNSASTVNLANSTAVIGNVISTGGANGTLNFASANLTGSVGTSAANGMALVAFGNTSGTTSTVTGNVYGTNINVISTGAAVIQGTTNGIVGINGTGSLNSFGTVTGNVNYAADGTLTVGNAAGTGAGIVGAVTTATNNTGTLAFAGTGSNTVSSGVGTSTNKLKVVSVGAGNITFQSSGFYATTLSFTSSGTADLIAAGTSVGTQTIAFAGNNGTVKFASATNYSGTVTTTSTGTGNLNFASGSTVSGTIGAGGNKLNTLFFTDGANTISSVVHATKTDIGAATVNVTNTTFDSGVNFSNNAGVITFASGSTVTGNVTATAPGDGKIVYSGPLAITGDVGRIKTLDLAGTLTVNGNATAADSMNVGIASMQVNGTFATTANTSLVYRVNTPTTSGKITSTGNATVDANTAVNMVVDTGVYVNQGQQFVLIDGNNAGTGIATLAAGKLTTTDTTLLHFKQDLTNTHDLVVFADRTQITTVASTDSNASLGKMLDSTGSFSNPEVNAFQVALGQQTTSTGVNNLLSTVVAPTDTSIAATTSASNSIGNVIQTHIETGSTGSVSLGGGSSDDSGVSGGNEAMSKNVWFQGFGASAKQGLRNGAAGYDVGSYGAVFGMDKEMSEGFRAGVNLAYAQTNVNGKDLNRTGTDVDSYQAGVYGGYDFGNGYFANGQLAYMYNDMDTVRYNVGGVAANVARASFHSSQYSARTEAGRVIAVPSNFTLTPSAVANYSYTDMSKYSETGAGGLSLSNVNPDDPQIFELGVRLKAETKISDSAGGAIKPSVMAGYRYDLIGDRAASVAGLVGGGTTFNTTGVKPARGTAEAGAGITWVSPYNVDIRAEYDYEHKSEYDSHAGFVRAGMKF